MKHPLDSLRSSATVISAAALVTDSKGSLWHQNHGVTMPVTVQTKLLGLIVATSQQQAKTHNRVAGIHLFLSLGNCHD
ncbi:MAG TPA: hypothetical protein VJC18_06105 [bacterium]|nr:hypothetical protein [bacterium]